MDILNFFAAGEVPRWVSESFPIVRIVLIVLLLLLAVAMTASILAQTSTSEGGLGAISGQSSETFYSKNKGRSLQGLLRRLTVIFAICILVLTVLYLVSVQIYSADMGSIMRAFTKR